MRCYCSICWKTGGGGGYAISLHADARTRELVGETRVFHARIDDGHGRHEISTAERHFCSVCASPLWVFSPEYPDLFHPLASAIDSDLPKPPSLIHMMLGLQSTWVEPHIGPENQCFDAYPGETLANWHRAHALWID